MKLAMMMASGIQKKTTPVIFSKSDRVLDTGNSHIRSKKQLEKKLSTFTCMVDNESRRFKVSITFQNPQLPAASIKGTLVIDKSTQGFRSKPKFTFISEDEQVIVRLSTSKYKATAKIEDQRISTRPGVVTGNRQDSTCQVTHLVNISSYPIQVTEDVRAPTHTADHPIQVTEALRDSIFSSIDLLGNIFEHLPLKDLLTVASVSKKWSEAKKGKYSYIGCSEVLKRMRQHNDVSYSQAINFLIKQDNIIGALSIFDQIPEDSEHKRLSQNLLFPVLIEKQKYLPLDKRQSMACFQLGIIGI